YFFSSRRLHTRFSCDWSLVVCSSDLTVALLVMGFFMVNSETIYPEAMTLGVHAWKILMAVGISLIWIDYKRIPRLSNRLALGLKIGRASCRVRVEFSLFT